MAGSDLHDGLRAARALTRDTDRVSLLKADIFVLPFRGESFDSIMSAGFLHHTGNTFEALRALLPLPKPGGRLFVQVYETRGAVKDRRMTRLLRITERMPRRLLYWLCAVLVAAR